MTLARWLLTRLPRRHALGRVAAGALALASTLALVASPTARATSVVSVQVEGNQLIDAAGQPFRLLGVDRSGTEYACAEGWGIFDGPSDATSIAAMKAWGIDTVRVPLNEDCWLGINGVNPEWSGANYQSAIEQYVAQLNAAGLVAILDLHWSAPGTQVALGQQVMADADHSPAFWTSVATAFKTDPGVVFDLYNEPHDISWSCWLNGCTTPAGWKTAGMQSLVDAVRSAGATQPLMVAGLNWAGDLSGWLSHEPIDPLHQLIASVHIYSYSQCNAEACWQSTIAPVAQQVPVVTGELGETDCGTGFIDTYMSWADAHDISYLAWSWNTASCSAGPALITSYNGTPTPYGAGFEAHLAALGVATGTPSSTTTTTTSPTASGDVPVGLDGYGNLDAPPGTGLTATTSDTWPGWDIARAVAALPSGTGGYVLDGWGGIHPFAVGDNPLPPPATPSGYWPDQDVARGIALLPDGTGGYVLDQSGGIHPFAVGSNPLPPPATPSAAWPGQDMAVGLVLLPGGQGGYVLDAFGGVHPFAIGDNPLPPPATTTATWPGWGIARAIVLLPSGTGGYVLDGWGGIHPFAVGDNPLPPPATTSGYWPDQDVARGLVLLPDGTAGYIVTRLGAISPFTTGSAPMPPSVPALAPASGTAIQAALVVPSSPSPQP